MARRAPLWRVLLSLLFLLLFCAAAPVALLAGWAWQATGNSAAYGVTANQAANDARVRESLTDAVTARAERMLAGDNPTATEAVQARAVAEDLGEAVARLAKSATFRDVWAAASRDAYRSLFSGATAGPGTPVVLDLSPLAAPLRAEVERGDFDLPPGFAIDPAELRLELLDGASADRIRLAAARLALAFWLALAVAVVALILSIAVTPNRLAAIARAGFGLTIGMVILIALMVAAQQWAASAGDAGPAVLGAILDAISRPLRLGAVALAVFGLLLAALFAGLGALYGGAARRPRID